MKKTILSIAVAGMLFTSCSDEGTKIDANIINNPNTAEENATPTEMPQMVFVEEVYDFGKITQGEKVKFAYDFKNEGKVDLIITSAKGSCGCTVPSWPKEPIKPGETGKIDVVFDSNGKTGKQHKKVTIIANTMPATNVVSLKGEIIVPEKTAE